MVWKWFNYRDENKEGAYPGCSLVSFLHSPAIVLFGSGKTLRQSSGLDIP